MSFVPRSQQPIPLTGIRQSGLQSGEQGSGYVSNLILSDGVMMSRRGYGLLDAISPTGLPSQTPLRLSYATILSTADRDLLIRCGTTQTYSSDQQFSTGGAQTNSPEASLISAHVVLITDLKRLRTMSQILYGSVVGDPTPLYDSYPAGTTGGGWELDPNTLTAYRYTRQTRSPIPVSGKGFWTSTQQGDTLLIHHPDTGTYVVLPAPISSVTRVGSDGCVGRDSQSGQGDPAWLRPLRLRDGLLTDAFTYLTQQDLPPIVAITSWQGRTVYVAESAILFSDPDAPDQIIADNVQNIPLERGTLVAATQMRSNLVLFGPSETWVMSPSSDAIAANGQLSLLSGTDGVSSPHLITQFGDEVVFCSPRGLLSTDTSLANSLTEPVRRLFLPQTTPALNPHNTQWAQPNPQTTSNQVELLQTVDLTGATLAQNPQTRQLFLSLPAQNRALVWQDGQVCEQRFEALTPNLGLTTQIPAARLLATPSGTTLLVSGDFVTAYGRGGNLDMTSGGEDHRNPRGRSMRLYTPGGISTSNVGAFRLSPTRRVPPQYRTPYQTTGSDTFCIEMAIQVPDLTGTPDLINQILLEVTLHPAFRWLTKPLAPNELDITLSNQTEAIEQGLSTSVVGQTAFIQWQDPGVIAWNTYPDPALPPHRYLSFARLYVTRNATTPPTNPILSITRSEISTTTPTTLIVPVYVGDVGDWFVGYAGEDDLQQGVDWYLSTELLGGVGNLARLRGLFLQSQITGNAANRLSPDLSVLCYLITSLDADVSPTVAQLNGSTLRNPAQVAGEIDQLIPTGALGSGLTQQVVAPRWGDLAWRYGDVANPATGNILVGSIPTLPYSIPSDLSGNLMRIALSGYIRNPSESVAFPVTGLMANYLPQFTQRRRFG